jgi:hypothetical protein
VVVEDARANPPADATSKQRSHEIFESCGFLHPNNRWGSVYSAQYCYCILDIHYASLLLQHNSLTFLTFFDFFVLYTVLYRSRPIRSTHWLHTEMGAVRNDLLAVNYIRFRLTFGETVLNPFQQYAYLVTRSPSQNYALLLFSDFLSLTGDVPLTSVANSNAIDGKLNGVTWLHYVQINVSGAIR